MAWVDHDDRAIVRRSCRFGRLSRCDQRVGIGKGRPQFGPRFLCQRLHESRAVDLGQLQPFDQTEDPRDTNVRAQGL